MVTQVDSIGLNNYAVQQYPQFTYVNPQQNGNVGLQYQQELQNDTVSFSGNVEEKNNGRKGLKIAAGVILTAAAAAVLHKNWGSISKWAKGLFKGAEKAGKAATEVKTSVKAEQVLNKAKGKIQGLPGKVKIKNTSVTGAAKTATEASKAKIVQNINVQHANASSRKLVEQAAKEIVTPEAQRAYNASIAYKAPNAAQKRALAELASNNKAQRAAVNTVGNLAKGGEQLEQVAAKVTTEAAKQAKVAKNIVAGVPYKLASGNAYVTDKSGNIVKVILKDGHELTDKLKIAKHLDKTNVNLETLLQSVRLAA